MWDPNMLPLLEKRFILKAKNLEIPTEVDVLSPKLHPWLLSHATG